MRKLVFSLLSAVSLAAITANPVKAATAFICSHTSGITSTHDGTNFDTRATQEAMTTTYAALDSAAGTAQLIGSVGSETVHYLPSDKVLNFVEVTMSGAVNTATIYLPPLPDGRYASVYSRHTSLLMGEPMPSQWFGVCEVRE